MADAIVKVVLFLCSTDLFSHLAEAIESAIKDVEFSLFFVDFDWVSCLFAQFEEDSS